MLLAFLTLFLQASRSNRFDSKIPRSLLMVFISPSKKRRSGCMKHECDEPIKSRSHCPSFCSACPTFVKQLPYGPSLPNSAPAFNLQSQQYFHQKCAQLNMYLNHVQSHVLQVTQASRFFLFNFFENEIFGSIAWIRNQHRFRVTHNFFGPFFGRICAFGKRLKMWVEFSFFRCSKFFLGQLEKKTCKIHDNNFYAWIDSKQKNFVAGGGRWQWVVHYANLYRILIWKILQDFPISVSINGHLIRTILSINRQYEFIPEQLSIAGFQLLSQTFSH